MKLTDEIHSFAREFINDKSSRSIYRKGKVLRAYNELTGKVLRPSCSTCFIEALLHIINKTKMSTFNYRLKKGYVAQFDIPYQGIKAFTNVEMTDQLAKVFLERHPARIIYFEKYPEQVTGAPGVKVVTPPKKKAPAEVAEAAAPKTEVIQPQNILRETAEGLTFEENKEESKKVKTLSQMNKAELVTEALKYPDIKDPGKYTNFNLANLIRKATGIKPLTKIKK